MPNILIQLIGFTGSTLAAVSVQFKSRRTMMLMQLLSCVFWVIHYGTLGAVTGAVSGILSFLRVAVMSSDKPWASGKRCLWLFLSLFLLNVVFTWSGPESILVGIASCCTTNALWTRDMRKSRLWFLADAPCWLVYNIVTGSVSGIIVESFALLSYISAIIRHDILRKT